MKKPRHIHLAVIGTILTLLLVQCTKTAPQSELSEDGRIPIRWFVGLEFGSNFNELDGIEAVVADFNAAQDDIELQLDVASIAGAYDLFATEISSGNGPDIVGPISGGMASGFPDQWLDLTPYLLNADFDTSRYDPAILAMYQTEDGQTLSLPFSVSPAALYFVPKMFDEFGLAYPPQVVGEMYELDGRIQPWNWETVAEVAQRLTIDEHNNNATQPEFDRHDMVQVGFHPQGQNMASFATHWGAAKMYATTKDGRYVSTIPDEWKAAWQWWHEGIWSEHPYMAPFNLAETIEFGNGSVFYAGKAAMALGEAEDLCCVTDVQVAVLPVDGEGRVNGRISETSFYIWQGTDHPDAAFTVLTYLLTTGSDKLLLAYDAMPAANDQLDSYFARKAVQYPTITPASWHVFVQNRAYPDIPSADQYLPHRNEARYRLRLFADRFITTDITDFDAEFQQLQDDLTLIYNK